MRNLKARVDLASTGGARDGQASAGSPDSPAVAAAERAIAAHEHLEGPLLPVLHAVQRELGHIPDDAARAVAEALNLSRAEVHGVITFYPHFRTRPAGRHTVAICRAESCQAMGGEALAAHASASLGCDFHGTTADDAFTLEPVYCLGLCAQSPAAMIDGRPHARLTPTRLDRLLAQAREATP